VSDAVAELTARRLQALTSREQATGRLPSLVAGVVREGFLCWAGSRGEHTGSLPPSSDLQYRIGSITKTLTAVLVLQLRDEGALDLNDRLDAHLPGVGHGDRTLRALLSHSAGISSEPPGPWWERSPGRPFADLTDALEGAPPGALAAAPAEALAGALDDPGAPFPSGATYHYSNLAFALLGEVVARHRGSSWWEQVQGRVLAPLGMRRTSYLPQPPAATGYSVHHFAGTLTEEPAHDAAAMAPAGQLWSTLGDLATYADFLVGGNDAVLARDTLDEMTTPQSGSRSGGLSGGHGLGLRLVAGGSGTLVGHTGSMPGFLAALLLDRERRTGAVALANGTTGLRAEAFPLELLDALEELEPALTPVWRPAEAVPPAVAELLGLWHWGNTAFAFSWTGNQVEVAQLGQGVVAYSFSLRPDGTFIGTSG
jgi:CubicO group peptidase (beta-lactamase class C family)